MSPLRTVLVLAALAALPLPAPAGLADAWYLARGRANMQIGNYAAAIEAYRKAVELDPRNREASHALGLALQRNGETDAAVAQYDRHLERFPGDAGVAFELARILQWSRYAYRAGDAVRYLRLGLRHRDDPARRRELARLLSRTPSTRDEAIAEYRKLLAAAPDDRALRDEHLKLLLWDPRRRGEAREELERREREDPRDEQVARDLARLAGEEPRRAAEAERRYGALVARHPSDPELRLGHARALARLGRREEARAAYAQVVAARPGWLEARLEHADLLAGDPATQDEARRAYEAAMRDAPRDRRARLGLARLLGSRKETTPDAIRVYSAVLREAPRDAEAHRGLARAYAWEGEEDRALAHAVEARRLGPERDDLARLRQDLRAGREPAAGGGARLFAQPTRGARLVRSGGFVAGAAEPTPFTSSAVEAGFAAARGEVGEEAAGAWVDVRGELRRGEGQRVRLSAGWDGARRARPLAGELALEGEAFSLRAVHAPRLDSFRAYAGAATAGGLLGAATETFGEVRYRRGGEVPVTVAVRAGSAGAAGVAGVLLAGAEGRVGRLLGELGPLRVEAAAAASAVHHGRDLAEAGLFSPPLHATASPRLALMAGGGPAGWLVLDAGPALQWTAGPGCGARIGGDAALAFARRLGTSLRLGGHFRAERVAAAHARLEAALSLSLLFP